MKTRNKSYIDYGISKQKANELKKRCQTLNARERDILMECCKCANQGIAYEMMYSLIYGVSYDKLIACVYIPALREDFYAYRRKALSLFNEHLREETK